MKYHKCFDLKGGTCNICERHNVKIFRAHIADGHRMLSTPACDLCCDSRRQYPFVARDPSLIFEHQPHLEKTSNILRVNLKNDWFRFVNPLTSMVLPGEYQRVQYEPHVVNTSSGKSIFLKEAIEYSINEETKKRADDHDEILEEVKENLF